MRQDNFDWTVVGAGPAGIAAIGKLIDNHVNPERIGWIDPTFTVGDFGAKWRKVPSNTQVNLFLKFLMACQSFRYESCQENFALHTLSPDHTCQLQYMADPLQWVTETLKKQVHCLTGFVQKMRKVQDRWKIVLESDVIYTDKVILAIGSEPKTLPFAQKNGVPLDITFDPERLARECTVDDTVAVFGSSHSAILIIRNLLERCEVKQVINFYQSPLIYAEYVGDEILFDDTGLKGTTAGWARENIDGKLPEKLMRVISTQEAIEKYSDICTKSIHAVGFSRRPFVIEGIEDITYDDRTGVIAPGLFGVGIAFPEAKTNRLGIVEYRVGLWKFMEYLTRVLPVWVQSSNMIG